MQVRLDTKKLLGYRALAGAGAMKLEGKVGRKGGGGVPNTLGVKAGAKLGAKGGGGPVLY